MIDTIIYLDSVIEDARGNPNYNLQVRAEYLMECRRELAYRREAMNTFSKMFDPKRNQFLQKTPNWTTISEPQSSLPESYVYFITEEGDERFVKIGRAKDIRYRLDMLQTGNPRLLKVMRKMPGAQRLESWMRNKFKQQHIRSEWYHTQEEMATIQSPWPDSDL